MKDTWTPEEDNILKRHYHQGAHEVQTALKPHSSRTLMSIYKRARKLGLRQNENNAIKPTEPHLARAFMDVIQTYDAGQTLLDGDQHQHEQTTLFELERRYLIRHVGTNLWRPTLAGIAYAREGVPPTRTYKRPTNKEQILQYVRENPGATLAEAAQETTVSISSARDTANRLEKAGHIKHTWVKREGRPTKTLYPA